VAAKAPTALEEIAAVSGNDPSPPPVDKGFWSVRHLWPGAVSLGLYVFLTFLEFGLSTSLGSGRMAVEDGSDGVSQVWFLEWTQYALAHGHNPFFTQWQSFPGGFNVLSDTSMVALGTIFSPITTLFGPIVTWNVLVRLAVILSAFSMCLVLRRWTKWWPAAFFGGLIYGYSAYVTFNLGHLFLVFVPLPPFMFLLLHEILVRQRWRPGRTGALLGAACGVQYLISSEILVTTILMGAVATVLYFVACRNALATKWPYMRTSLIFSIGVGGVLLVYPVLYTLFGADHLAGAPQSPATLSALHGDLFSAFAPGSNELFRSTFAQVSRKGETLYLGFPLIVMMVATVVLLRRRRVVPFAAAMTVVAYVLSLGQRLYVDGHYTQIPLPFEFLAHLPYLKSLLAIRFSLFTVMFGAGIAAIGLDAFYWRMKHSDRPSWLAIRWKVATTFALPLGLAVIVAIPIVSTGTQEAIPTDVSPYFTSNAVKAIPNGSVVLAYPYPRSPQIGRSFTDHVDQALLDQAVSGMEFKLIGGYGWWPVPHETYATPNAPPLKPFIVETLFDAEFYGGATTSQAVALYRSDVSGHLPAALRQFMMQQHVDTVIVLPVGKHPATVVSEVTAAIGPPVRTDGVAVWLHIQQRLAAVAS
jgi:hypothetical protein